MDLTPVPAACGRRRGGRSARLAGSTGLTFVALGATNVSVVGRASEVGGVATLDDARGAGAA